MKRFFLFIALIMLSNFLQAQNKWFEIYTDAAIFKQNNDELIKDFENQVKKIDPGFSFNGLKTIIRDSLPSGFYNAEENNLFTLMEKYSGMDKRFYSKNSWR